MADDGSVVGATSIAGSAIGLGEGEDIDDIDDGRLEAASDGASGEVRDVGRGACVPLRAPVPDTDTVASPAAVVVSSAGVVPSAVIDSSSPASFSEFVERVEAFRFNAFSSRLAADLPIVAFPSFASTMPSSVAASPIEGETSGPE